MQLFSFLRRNPADRGTVEKPPTLATVNSEALLAIEKLKAPSMEERISALRYLRHAHEFSAFEPVRRVALEDENWKVRKEAVRALERLGTDKTLEEVYRKDKCPAVRAAVVQSFDHLKEYWFHSISDKDSHCGVRVQWYYLKGCGSPAPITIQAIAELVNRDEKGDICAAFTRALLAATDEGSLKDLHERGEREGDLQLNKNMTHWRIKVITDREALDTLCEIGLKDQSLTVVLAALWALRGTQDPTTVKTLCEIGLTHPLAEVREGSAKVLQDTRDTTAIQALIQAGLRDDDSRVRTASFTAISGTNNPAGIKALIEGGLRDKERQVRAAAARALTHVDDPAGLKALLEVGVKDKDWEVREAAVTALKRFNRQPAVKEALREAFYRDDNEEVRLSADQALLSPGEIMPRVRSRLGI